MVNDANERQDELDRKVVAYTSVAGMTPAEFERLIEGRWKTRPRSGNISPRVPDDISQRVARWAEWEANMTDTQMDLDPERRRAIRRAVENQKDAAKATYPHFVEVGDGPKPRPSIPRQLGAIGKSLFHVVRAWWKGIP